MFPKDLKPGQFDGYPPLARAAVVAHLETLRQLPLGFVPSLLREVIDYDFKFPVERAAIDTELASLSALSPAQIAEWFGGFAQFSLSPKLEHFDWVAQPAQFVEQLSAHLWTTHQLDAFRKAATDYGTRLQSITPPQPLPVNRLGVAVVGQGVASYDAPLFRKLREHGTYFTNIKPDDGLAQLLKAVSARAEAHPVPYGHWYVDGGQPVYHDNALTCISYRGMEPMRAALLRRIQTEIQRPGMGPEELRTHLAELLPSDLEIDKAQDEVLSRFQVKLLTEGSGTQIFSTTFAQWTAREVLRRAQALTLIVRFAPRQRQRPMNELLTGSQSETELDVTGSLVDADMAAYYQWINQQRLPGYQQSSFVAWFENHSHAVVIGPSLPRGTTSKSAMSLKDLLALATS